MDANENAIVEEIEKMDSWKLQILVLGAVLGAMVGLGAALLLAQNAEKEGKHPEVTAVDGVKLGVLVMGLLRMVSTIGEGK
jgi:hypothetical protein